MKLKEYIKVISDTNECLGMEPNNVKALLRKGRAFVELQKPSEALDTYEKILDLDASNQTALTELVELRKKVPLKNSFRMTIEEIEEDAPSEKKIVRKTEKLELSEVNHVPKLVQNIVIDEPTPFDKMMPMKKKARETLVMPNDAQPTNKKTSLIQEIQ